MLNGMKTKFNNWLGKVIYAALIAGHNEDYVIEENGQIKTVPADVWHAAVLKSKQK